jgi:hypothetical protein
MWRGQLIGSMLVLSGAAAVFFPTGMVQASTSYNTTDLVRGWGLYAAALGLVVAFPARAFGILAACFAASIAWHLQIVYRRDIAPRGWTSHHLHSLLANAVALAFVFWVGPYMEA